MKYFKILFLLLLMIPSIASADYTFYVENADMVDSYFNIFNAIAMLFQSTSYIDLLRLVFLFGGFFVFIGGVISGFGKDGKGALSGYAAYTFTGFAFLSIIFSTPTTLWIEAETLPSYCSASSQTTGVAVGNVPNVLAYTFATINSVGRGMTSLAETAFTVPTSAGSTSMKDSGGYLGSLKSAIKLLTLKSNDVMLNYNSTGGQPLDLDTAMQTFYGECIMIPFSSAPEGQPVVAGLLAQFNIFKYLDDLYTANTVSVNGTLVGDFLFNWYGETWTCKGFFQNVLKPAFITYKTDVKCAVKANAGAIQLLTGEKGAPESKFEEFAQQAASINQMENVNKNLGVSVSGSGYAAGKTKADFIQTSFASGSYFAEMLPYLQMTLRAILYSFFPFVFIVVMMPGGIKVIAQYMQTLLWIELWSPTAAIVNMFVLKKAESDMGGQYISDEGLTLINSMKMLESATTISAIGAYLYASVPALTWLILKGSGDMLGNVAGAMGAKMATNIQTDAINKDFTAQTDAGLREESLTKAARNKARADGAVSAGTYGVMDKYDTQSIADDKGRPISKSMIATTMIKEAGILESSNISGGALEAKKSAYETEGVKGTGGSKNQITMGLAKGSEAAGNDNAQLNEMHALGFNNDENGRTGYSNFIAETKGYDDAGKRKAIDLRLGEIAKRDNITKEEAAIKHGGQEGMLSALKFQEQKSEREHIGTEDQQNTFAIKAGEGNAYNKQKDTASTLEVKDSFSYTKAGHLDAFSKKESLEATVEEERLLGKEGWKLAGDGKGFNSSVTASATDLERVTLGVNLTNALESKAMDEASGIKSNQLLKEGNGGIAPTTKLKTDTKAEKEQEGITSTKVKMNASHKDAVGTGQDYGHTSGRGEVERKSELDANNELAQKSLPEQIDQDLHKIKGDIKDSKAFKKQTKNMTKEGSELIADREVLKLSLEHGIAGKQQVRDVYNSELANINQRRDQKLKESAGISKEDIKKFNKMEEDIKIEEGYLKREESAGNTSASNFRRKNIESLKKNKDYKTPKDKLDSFRTNNSAEYSKIISNSNSELQGMKNFYSKSGLIEFDKNQHAVGFASQMTGKSDVDIAKIHGALKGGELKFTGPSGESHDITRDIRNKKVTDTHTSSVGYGRKSVYGDDTLALVHDTGVIKPSTLRLSATAGNMLGDLGQLMVAKKIMGIK